MGFGDILSIKNNGALKQLQEYDIPKVYINGDTYTMTKEVSTDLNLSYKSNTNSFDCIVNMKWQGTSSIAYPKKNFTIKMYTDETKNNKFKKSFKNWGSQNKFCLKANYIDHTHARNIIGARLWGQMVKSRNIDYPTELKSSPNYGAIDGFPIKLFLNGVYEGLYTWNIPKDGWMFNMNKNNVNHAILCDESQVGAGAFASLAIIDGTDWSLEFPDNLTPVIKNSFNNAIAHVKDSSDIEFKQNLSNYFDVSALIDYYIFCYRFYAMDNLAKNMMMVTYDGQHWIASVYDMDSVFGLYYDGGVQTSYNQKLPDDYSCKVSVLWDKLKRTFGTEIHERYMELSNTVLSDNNLLFEIERFTDIIPKTLYDEDLIIYSNIPSGTDNIPQQIKQYTKQRSTYVKEDIVKNSLNYINIFPENTRFFANTVVNTQNGIAYEDNGWHSTDFFEITPEINYCLSTIGSWQMIHFYNKDKKWMSSIDGGSGDGSIKSWVTGKSPNASKYAKISIRKDAYSRMLEINSTSSIYEPSSGVLNRDVEARDNLLVWLNGSNFDAGSTKQIWYDKSGNYNDFTIFIESFLDGRGWTGNSLVLKGTSNNFIENRSLILTQASNFTVELYAKLGVIKTPVLSNTSNWSDNGFWVEVFDGTMFIKANGSVVLYQEAVNNEATHITVRVNSDSTFDIFINGEKKTKVNSPIYVNGTNNDGWYIGRIPWDGGLKSNLEVYDFKLFNIARTDEEIVNDYTDAIS